MIAGTGDATLLVSFAGVPWVPIARESFP